MGTSLFEKHTKTEQAQSLANYLPGGQFFIAKNVQDTNFRRLLQGFSTELQRNEEILIDTSVEHDIECTTQLIGEWEKSLGIPDDCYPGTGDIEERRTHVIAKLALMNVATREDFEFLAAFLGFTVTIESAREAFGLGLPSPLPFSLLSNVAARFTWVVRGENIAIVGLPLNLPFELRKSETLLQCVFNKLKPANTLILFLNT